MQPTLEDVLTTLEELWPASLAEDWDRVGLVLGRPEAGIQRILFAVDPTLEVAQDAVDHEVQLIITHHPLLLRGINSVAAVNGKGRIIHQLIENHCALATVHTNADSAIGGVSDILADALELRDTTPLQTAGHGFPGEGIGRVGNLPEMMSLAAFAERVFSILPAVAGGVRVSGDRQALVRRIAVCGGAGDSLFDLVRQEDADVYVTADLRHHPALEAREQQVDGRPYLMDISHFASEWLWLPAAAQTLAAALADQGFEVDVQVSQRNTDPWDFILTPG